MRRPALLVNTPLAGFVAYLTFTVAVVAGANSASLAPLPPTPTAAQLQWADAELGLYVRLDLRTVAGGTLEPARFDPPALDPSAWAHIAAADGFRRVVLSANDADGFCFWPTSTTNFSIARSPWHGGRGDVVRAFVDACRAAHLAVGFSVTGYERGVAVSDARLRGMLTELLTHYGPVAEIRLDGAGGEGNGALPTFDPARIAAQPHRDWPAIFACIRAAQPDTVIVSNIGPDARWNGNNIGHCGDPLWAPFDPGQFPGPELTNKAQLSRLNSGDPNGPAWVPGEAFVPLRAAWAWRDGDDSRLVTLDRLFSAYCKSIGRNAALLLSVPTMPDGRLPAADVARLAQLHERVAAVFGKNLAADAPVTATNVRGNDPHYAAQNAIDGRADTYWAADDGSAECSLTIDLGAARKFGLLEMREPVALGQRITGWRAEVPDGNGWKLLVRGKGVGRRKIERFPATTASRLRIVIEHSRAAPALSEIGLFAETP